MGYITDVYRPVGRILQPALVPQGAASNWQCVDESSADDTDYVYLIASFEGQETEGQDLYSVSTTPVGEIYSVTVKIRARKETGVSLGKVAPLVYSQPGIVSTGSISNLTTSYSSYSYEWTVDPQTGSQWTWGNLLGIGVKLVTDSNVITHPVRASQVWGEVQHSQSVQSVVVPVGKKVTIPAGRKVTLGLV
jgi:hypothetical protein